MKTAEEITVQKTSVQLKGKLFNYCSKVHHFALMCRKKLQETKGIMHEVNNESDLETEQPGEHYDNFVDSIDYDKKQSQALAKIALGPKSKIISMKLDSGSQVNIIPKSIFRSLGVNAPLQKTNKCLTAYGKKPLKVYSYIKLQCLYKGRKTTEDFYIVDTNSSPHSWPRHLSVF